MKTLARIHKKTSTAVCFAFCSLLFTSLACNFSLPAISRPTLAPTFGPPATAVDIQQSDSSQPDSVQVVYQSDFSTTAGWPTRADLVIENNELTFNPSGYSLTWARDYIDSLGDFSLTATFRYDTGGQDDYGVAVVIGDPLNQNFFFLGPNPHQGDTAWYFVMVKRNDYIHATDVSTPITDGQPEEFTVEIRRQGTQVTAYANGEKLMTRDDIVFDGKAKQMYVGVYSDGYNDSITLTNLTVTTLPENVVAGSGSGSEAAINAFLLSPQDLPNGYTRAKTDILFDQTNGYRLIATYDDLPGSGTGLAALECYVSVLDRPGTASDVGVAGLSPVDSPQVGDVSQAYRLDLVGGASSSQFNFVKNNILVSMRAVNDAGDVALDVEDVAALAQIIASRIPGNIEVPVIGVDDNPANLSVRDQYFSNLETGMGELQFGGPAKVTPATSYSAGEGFPCVIMDTLTPIPEFSLALYDQQNMVYMEKIIIPIKTQPGHYETCSDLSQYGLLPGDYEFKVLVGDVLVDELPFEIR